MKNEPMPIEPTESSYTDFGFEVLELKLISNSGGEPINLENMWLEISVTESIWKNLMYGEIVFKDGMNLSETLPVVGNETILLSFKTKGDKADPIKITGKVYTTLGKARVTNEKSEVYKLEFVSNITFADRISRVNGSLRGTISDIVGNLFLSSFGKESVSKLRIGEKTKTIHKFVFPNWSPLYCMRWLATRAFSSQSEPSLFLFYEDVDGFHFKNLISELSKPTKMTYRVEPKSSANITSIDGFLSRVEEYSILSYYDRLDELADGMFSSSLLTHDITSKKFSTNTRNYIETFDNTPVHLNKHPLFPRETQMTETMTTAYAAHRSVIPLQTDAFNSIKQNDFSEKYFLDRKSLMKQFDTVKISIKVPGNSGMRLLDTVNFSIPKIGYIDESDSDWEDQYLSGKYIVTSIKTTINKIGRYTTIMDLSKESSVRGIPSKFDEKKLFT